MKECKILQFLYMEKQSRDIQMIGSCMQKDYPDIEKELNKYINDGWKICATMGWGNFYLERDVRPYVEI